MQAPFRSARRVVAVLAAASALIISCSEAPSGPQRVRDDAAATDANLLGGLLNNLHLLSCTTQSYDSVTRVIGAGGGTINVGTHVFSVPAGALDHNVAITAVTPSVNRREVQFAPHGLTFDRPATLTMSYAGCSLISQILPKKIVYMDDDLNPLELLLSLDNILSRKVTGKIGHFSSYAVWQ